MAEHDEGNDESAGRQGDDPGQALVDELTSAAAAASSQDRGTKDSETETGDGLLSGEVVIPFKGATRKVDANELVRAFEKASELDGQRAALETLLEGNDLAKRFAKASPEQREQIEALLNGRASERPAASAAEDDDEFDDGLADDLLGKVSEGEGGDDEIRAAIKLLAKGQREIASYLSKGIEEKGKADLAADVSARMARYPVFQQMLKHPKLREGVKFAQQHVLMRLGEQPDADVEGLIAETAATMNGMAMAQRRDVFEERTGGTPETFELPENLDVTKYGGDDLTSGKMRRDLEKILAGRFGPS